MDTKESILAAAEAAAKVAPVEVPEFGATWFVRAMDGPAFEKFQREHDAQRDAGRQTAWLATWTLCDAEGQALFAPADVAKLAKLPGPVLMRIFDAAAKLNGMSAEEQEKN